jgi:plasmid stabilization system protein ParE
MFSVKYSNQAEIDLENAISYIAEESVKNALYYLKNYEDKIELLRLNPYMGVECKNKLINRDCRVLLYKSHIIIYKVNKELNEIFIVRIYHTTVDYANKLNKKNSDEKR